MIFKYWAVIILLLQTFFHLFTSQPNFCDLSSFKFSRNAGRGQGILHSKVVGGCDVVEMWSTSNDGLAASYHSPRMDITAARKYIASFSFKTQNLHPIAGVKGAYLTASVYLHFFDGNGDSGAWNPQFGKLAPANSTEYINVETEFITPTTAKTVELHLAFAAHTTAYDPNRMIGGRATGRAWLGNLTFINGGPSPPKPPTIMLPDTNIQDAIGLAFSCLSNSKQSGNFTVGAGYTISGNISPDLTFGLYGVRRTGYPTYIAQMQKQWDWHAPSMKTGHYDAGRVMGQINWPLGIDNIFSFIGDQKYLKDRLPLVDASFSYINAHTGSDNLVTLIPVGHGHNGGGADWVDWYKTRLDGKTFQYHMWYRRSLLRFANLHDEFAASFGNATLATIYRNRADNLLVSLRTMFWERDHWRTNIDYPDEGEWMDDTVWSVWHNITNFSQANILWKHIDNNSAFFEGVPIRWGDFPTAHSKCSWFGRLGAGDILARFVTAQNDKAYSLLQRISSVFNKDHDIYEGYDMNGCGLHKCGCTTSGYGDYLEHCGGFIWTIIEGVFGINFDSTINYTATIAPRFPLSWANANASVYIRGTNVQVLWERYSNADATLTISQTGGTNQQLKLRAGCNGIGDKFFVLLSNKPFILQC